MRLLLIFILILIFILRLKDKEYFCVDNTGDICKFTKITLPIEKFYTLPEVKQYGETWANDIYNLLFNPYYETSIAGIEKNYTLENYFLEICYIHKTGTIDGILSVLNNILYENYELKESELDEIKKTDTVKEYFTKLRSLRYRIFSRLFDEQNLTDGLLINNEHEEINFTILKFYIFYLLMDENNEYYINNNLRYGIYLYLYEKNVFEISKDFHNDIYQYIILIIIDVLKRYIKIIFDKDYDNFDNISIKKIRNIIINNSIIDYNLVKKDLCYI